MTTKAKKPMRPINLQTLTLHTWIAKACKVSPYQAAEFLAMTMPFLVQSNLIGVTGETLAQYRAKLLYPTPTIHALIPLLVTHAAETSLKQAKERIEKQEKQSIWLVVVYDGCPTILHPDGKEVLREGFETAKEAEGWLDRRLEHQCSSAFGIVTSKTEKTVLRVDRDMAMFRLYGIKRAGTAMKTMHTRMHGLGMGMKAPRDSRANFSHG